MNGVIEPHMREDGSITVDMGAPRLATAEVPFDATGLTANNYFWPLQLKDKTVQVAVASMGNPHAVQLVDDVDTAPVESDGPVIEHHSRFPKRVNAGFMQVMDRNHVRLRVFERGAGETLACGTGACAAVVCGIRSGLLDSPVSVQMRGGELSIGWDGGTSPVTLTGPAVSVYEGEIDI
jgi:diaminopimelate epimerase